MENYTYRKAKKLICSESETAAMELHILCIYSKKAALILERHLSENCNISALIYQTFESTDFDRLKIEQYGRVRNMIYYLRSSTHLSSLINKIEKSCSIDELISRFQDSKIFWEHDRHSFHECFVIYCIYNHATFDGLEPIANLKELHCQIVNSISASCINSKLIHKYIAPYEYLKVVSDSERGFSVVLNSK